MAATGSGPIKPAQVFTIAPGVPFVDALAAGILDRHGAAGDPLRLAAVTVLLPTRRACRSLREAFLRRTGAGAMLLPLMRPLGDVDEAELVLGEDGEAGLAESLDQLPAIDGTRRQLLLARLIDAWWRRQGHDAGGVDQAARLAAELARLLDHVQTARLGFDALATLIPADYAAHWQITLDFLAVVTRHWPEILAAEGAVDPARRRNLLLDALAEQWRRSPPTDPVIAAGSTGSIPATADLLAVIAGLPAGSVVLPGLDRDLDDESWLCIGESHPQFGMKGLLERFGVGRAAVADWPLAADLPASSPERVRLLSEVMRPEATTDRWRELATLPAAAVDGLTRIDCDHPAEEAGVIALLMREALAEPARTAALVTPDRDLARRVAAAHRRWGIDIDDSAGVPLAATAPGSFLRLTAAAVAEAAAPVALLAALKHPLAAGGQNPGAFRTNVRALELLLLRGPRPAPGFDGLQAALDKMPERERLARWFRRLAAAAAPFAEALAASPVRLEVVAQAHAGFAEWLAADAEQPGAARLWAGEAGDAAADFTGGLVEALRGLDAAPGEDYPALFEALLAGRAVRSRHGGHPRLAIWGPLEARLQQADLVILGGLNEGSWPREAPADSWMSRPMRQAFGLPTAERWIGLAAHDFCEHAAARRVVLTRARKSGGSPTVPSRWLVRLAAVLRVPGLETTLAPPVSYPVLLHRLDRPSAFAPWPRPAPRPPLAARPRRLSVTEIGTWMTDPYAVFARRILGLRQIDPLDADPGAGDRGAFIHEALDRFLKLPAARRSAAALKEIGRECFEAAIDRPGVWAFWWPRFERIAEWFADHDAARRGEVAWSVTEVAGRIELRAPGGAFLLTAKADRIDGRRDGGLAIIDYKTGGVPSREDVDAGMAPQLPLEALIAAAGGFEGVPAEKVDELVYLRLSGGDPAGEERPASRSSDIADLIAVARKGVEALIARFDDPATPYLSCPRPGYESRYGAYDRLARVKEWSEGGR